MSWRQLALFSVVGVNDIVKPLQISERGFRHSLFTQKVFSDTIGLTGYWSWDRSGIKSTDRRWRWYSFDGKTVAANPKCVEYIQWLMSLKMV